MSMTVGRLEIELMASVARLQADMTSAKGIVGSAMADISRSVAQAKAVLGSLGIGLGVGALVLFAKSVIDATARFKDLAQEAGTTASALSKFEAPARMAGLGLEAVSSAIFKMSQAALEAKDPASKAAQALNAIGISTSQLKGLKPDEMFELVARALAGYSDGMAKNAIMQELFSKSGKEMSRVVAEIAGTSKLAATVTNEQAEAADRLGDQMVELQMNSEKFWRGIISEGVPAMNVMLKAFVDGQREGGLYAGAIAAVSAAFDVMLGKTPQAQLALVNQEIELHKKSVKDMDDLWAKLGMKINFEGQLAQAKAMNELLAKRAGIEHQIWQAEYAAQTKRATDWVNKSGKALDIKFDPAAAAARLAAAKKAEAEALKAEAAAVKLAAKQLEDYTKAAQAALDMDEQIAKEIAELTKKRDEAVLATEKTIAAIEFETSLLKLSSEEREVAIALRALETSGITKQDAAYEGLAERLRAAIKEQRGVRAQIDASVEAQRNSTRAWEEMSTVAGDFFADLVLNGKSAFDNLKKWLKDLLAQMIALFAKRWILNLAAGGSFLGSAGQALAGGVGSDTTAGGILNYASSAWSAYRGGAGVSAFFGGSGAVGAGGTGAFAGGTAAGSTSSSMAGMGVTVAWVAAVVAAMYANNELFTRGWRRPTDGTDSNPLTAVRQGGPLMGASYSADAIFRSLGFSDRMASLFSGSSMNTRLFGHRQRTNDAFGISGTIGPGGFTGQNWQDWSRRGGTFSGGDIRDTDRPPLDPSQVSFFAEFMSGLNTLTDVLSSTLGVDRGAALANYSRNVNLQFSENGNVDPERTRQMFADLFGSVLQEQVALLLDAGGEDQLSSYVRGLKGTGDELTAMVSEVIGVLDLIPTLNLNLDADALLAWQQGTESLGQTFQRVAGQITSFDAAFGTQAQNIAFAQSQISAAFAEMGIAIPASKSAFYDLVHGLDLSTEAGRALFDALMEVAPAFASLADAAAQFQQRVPGGRGPFVATPDNPHPFGRGPGRAGDPTPGITEVERAIMSLGDAARETATSLRAMQMEAKEGIGEWLKGVFTNNSISPLTPGERLDYARNAYSANLLKAQTGKGGDAEALGKYTGLAQQYLEELARYYGTGSVEYRQAFASVTSQGAELAGLLSAAGAPTKLSMSNGFKSVVDAIIELRRDVGLLTGEVVVGGRRATRAARQSGAALAAAVSEGALTF